jgi:two-component system sensor histidine kinase CreC
MSARNRVFAGILLIYVLGVAFLLHRIIADLDPRYRESAEESLVETSQLIASFIERDLAGDAIRVDRLRPAFQALGGRQFDAQIYALRKTRVELRVYVTDAAGRVLFDSTGEAEGEDYAAWRDVHLTLQGKYGARTTRVVADDPDSSVMYVAAPIHAQDRIVGVVTVGKPVHSFGQFVEASRRKIIEVGFISVAAILMLAVIVSVWLVHPLDFATKFARYVRTQHKLSLARLGRYALETFAAAYREMHDALAGRHQVSEYVQTLTHEIKGPLSAIRGAAELLQEPMPETDRQRFLSNIRRESLRIQELVDRLLELAAIESRHRLERVATIDLREVAEEVMQALRPIADGRRVALRLASAPREPALIEGDVFLVQRALSNLVDNAIDFSPADSTVEIELRTTPREVEVEIRDRGPGIPEYAQAKVFDKFFSLARPHSSKRSTGLGLTFVQAVVRMHQARVSLANAADGGTIAKLQFPRS